MGMYTTVKSPHGDVQFKYGDDFCELVAIGEPIKASTNFPVPDGIYDGLGKQLPNGGFAMFWVIVKSGAVTEVIPDAGDNDTRDKWHPPDLAQAAELSKAHGVPVMF
jgi:hypothetical protein